MKKAFIKLIGIVLILSIYLTYKVKHKRHIDGQVLIKKGTSTAEIAYTLKENGIIDFPIIFLAYAKLKGGPLKAGYYHFSGEYSMTDVYDVLNQGLVKEYVFTIIPGDNLFTIALKLETEGIVPQKEFLDFSFNTQNVKMFGLEGDSFEGYFPPETYRIPYNANTEDIVKIFLRVFEKRYLPYRERFRDRDISFYQGMIIASMVEKEAYLEEEKPKITGVIFNRIKKDMRLQIDATVIYGLMLEKRYQGKLRKEDMKFRSPFNTYTQNGLPPTPICSFTLSSLEAVLKPEKHDYLYYVLSRDRKHHIFSEDYETHLKNIKIHLK